MRGGTSRAAEKDECEVILSVGREIERFDTCMDSEVRRGHVHSGCSTSRRERKGDKGFRATRH